MPEEFTLEQQVLQALSLVIEPELGRDLVSLNMIRDLTIDGGEARFTVMLTTPACPYKDDIAAQAGVAAESVAGIDKASVTLDSSVPQDSRIQERLNLNIGNLIAVSSGKGGVGKSTVAANLAVSLAQMGAAVGVMDADILGPNLPMMMGVEKMPPPTGQRLNPAEAYGVKVMSMGFLVDPDRPMIWRGPMVHAAIRQFFSDVEWGDLDYLIIDLPPGTGDAQLTLAQSVPLTGAVIVSQPQNVALGDASRGLSMFEHVTVPIIGVVENMSGEVFGTGGGEAMAQARNVPFLGSVPLDPHVRSGGDDGTPIVVSHPDSAAAIALREIAEKVAARVSVIAFSQGQSTIPLSIIE